jgi:hypothetical protein
VAFKIDVLFEVIIELVVDLLAPDVKRKSLKDVQAANDVAESHALPAPPPTADQHLAKPE